MQNQESKLQAACVGWFRYNHPKYKGVLFSIPNGGKRNVITAVAMKREGALPGVADLMLAVSRHDFHGLFIEMKYGKNKLSAQQEDFKLNVEKHGYKYVCCYTFDEFEREVNFYLL